MKPLRAFFVALAVLLLALPAAAQTRVGTKKLEDMAQVLEAAGAQWEKQDYAGCARSLEEALRLASQKRNEALLAALPDAPEGWVKVEPKGAEQIANNPFAQAMAGAIGKMVQQEYREAGGNGRAQVTLTTDSPMVGMMAMAFANPAMLEEGSELIEYGRDKAVLKSKGDAPSELQIVIDGKHLVAVETRGLTEEQLFALFDQEAVDRLSARLRR